ncbi:MAG: hypothetical protein KIS66_15480 [Fimbriimonadaceae bacterium]|nr:hypothetical protein [Fimbriimonadaceae bacterium]
MQRSDCPEREFVLLQNQGAMRAFLRGHLILSERALATGCLDLGSYLFNSDEPIPTGAYVMLRTGGGESRWIRSKDGAPVFTLFVGRDRPLWSTAGSLHILNTQHTYVERQEPAYAY